MGVEPYLAASALQGVAGQLLVRRLCSHCKKAYTVQEQDWEWSYLGLQEPRTLYRAQGCPRCRHTGYGGRLPLQEVLLVEGSVRQGILDGWHEEALEKEARKTGFRSLRDDGREKVLAGETSAEELLRVLG